MKYLSKFVKLPITFHTVVIIYWWDNKTMDPFSSMPLNDKLHPVAFFEAFPNATKLPWDESRRIFSFDYKVQYIMV